MVASTDTALHVGELARLDPVHRAAHAVGHHLELHRVGGLATIKTKANSNRNASATSSPMGGHEPAALAIACRRLEYAMLALSILDPSQPALATLKA
jgi:hypothetical protein